MTNEIFINYRKSDTPAVGEHLALVLRQAFGADRVFVDRQIEVGKDFRPVILGALEHSSAVVICMGSSWETAKSREGSDLNDPEDWVRREIEIAIQAGKGLVPVLVDRPHPPSADALPQELRPLGMIQGVHLDMDSPADGIADLVEAVASASGLRRIRDPKRWLWAAALILLGGVLATSMRIVWEQWPRPIDSTAERIVELSESIQRRPELGSAGHWAVGLAVSFARSVQNDGSADFAIRALEQQAADGDSEWIELIATLERLESLRR